MMNGFTEARCILRRINIAQVVQDEFFGVVSGSCSGCLCSFIPSADTFELSIHGVSVPLGRFRMLFTLAICNDDRK